MFLAAATGAGIVAAHFGAGANERLHRRVMMVVVAAAAVVVLMGVAVGMIVIMLMGVAGVLLGVGHGAPDPRDDGLASI